MSTASREMVISRLWFQVAILTFVAGFAVLGYLAYVIYAEQPPIPKQVTDPQGQALFTGDDIMAGQHIFQKYGLMQHGTGCSATGPTWGPTSRPSIFTARPTRCSLSTGGGR